jgi:hypothetical protein
VLQEGTQAEEVWLALDDLPNLKFCEPTGPHIEKHFPKARSIQNWLW